MQNDFLSSLSLRARQAAALEAEPGVLQPRLTALFEPSARAVIPPVEKSSEPADLVEDETFSAAPARPAPRQAQTQAEHSLPERPLPGQPILPQTPPSPRTRPAEIARPGVQQPIQAFPAPAVTSQSVGAAEHRSIVPSITPVSASQPPTSRPAETAPQTATRLPAWPPSLLLQVKPAEPLHPDEPAISTHRQESRPAPVPFDETRSPASIISEQVAASPKELRPARSDSAQSLVPVNIASERKLLAALPAEPPTPTIHVTIGRIEVRATQAATPPRRTATSAPVMSLDEYLRRRQGGNS